VRWTQFNKEGRILRGMDWFAFEAGSFRILEVRAYCAAPIQRDLTRQELQDFDYAGRGYPLARPARALCMRGLNEPFAAAAGRPTKARELSANTSGDIMFTKNRIRASFPKSPEPAPPVIPPDSAQENREERIFLFESRVTH
jgi:hypothetical protein